MDNVSIYNMICNYTNINDFCSNKYSYAFIDVIQSGTSIITNKSENASVLRTDKTTGQTKIINELSNNPVPTCNINDDNEDTTEWECYLIYRYIASGTISDPPLQTFKDAQINLINASYNATIEDGILVNINNQNAILGSSIADQMSYKSILSYAQALYDDDNDAPMPLFNDKNGNIYTLSYADLIIVFKTYLEKIILYKNLKDTLVSKCSNAPCVDDIQQCNWCKTKPIAGSLINTAVITTIEKPTVQSCIVIESEQDTTPLCDSILTINIDNLGNTATEPSFGLNLGWSIAAVGNYLGNGFCPPSNTNYITKINNNQAIVQAGKALCDGYGLTAADGRKYLTIGIGAHWYEASLSGKSISVSVVFGGVPSSITDPIAAGAFNCPTAVFGWIYVYDDKTFEFVPGNGDQLVFS
jgi:hypothetical protein